MAGQKQAGASKPAAKKAAGDEKAAEASNAQVAELLDAEQEQGYRGQAVDSTPNENYTVAGVTAGAPTPETTLVDGDREKRATVDGAGIVTPVGEGE